MKLLILNGPNMNLLGIREPEIYGNITYEALRESLLSYCRDRNITAECIQSNHEGVLIDRIQQAFFEKTDGIIFNPGAYTHTSVALADCIRALPVPVAEVHISDVDHREDFRRVNYIRPVCVWSVSGHGIRGYFEAIDYFYDRNNKAEKNREKQ